MAQRPKVVAKLDRRTGQWRDGAGRFKEAPLKAPKLQDKRENGNSDKVKP